MSLFDRILHAGDKKTMRKIEVLTQQVNIWEDHYKTLSDSELRSKTKEFKERLDTGEDTLDTLLPEAFACVRETSTRVIGKRHYDSQIMGGIALHLGNVAEMATGEGKTLAATLPSYLNALTGDGVHIVTVNDYLAERDAIQMGRIHQFLGLKVSCLLNSLDQLERQKAYRADITYGTNHEFGFDYLRDNMALSKDETVQRGQAYAIVDEVDSILIDEARTPLIISGQSDSPIEWYAKLNELVSDFVEGEDYDFDEKENAISITKQGVEKAEDWTGVDILYQTENAKLVGQLHNALKAKELFLKDKHYVVAKGKIVIVDEHTGRTMEDRRYSEGLHQAIEAKEKVKIEPETNILASITLQNYFKLYKKLSGMTGTASTEAAELSQIYNLGVVKVPTNKPNIRIDHDDLIYQTEAAKLDAVVEDIRKRHKEGQPILVGTTSVEKSEQLSRILRKNHIKHNVLNAKNNKREADIIAEAGRKGTVTVSTNMAGRGTDIMLGGSPEKIAEQKLAKAKVRPPTDEEIAENPDIIEVYSKKYSEALAQAEEQVKNEHEEVLKVGGLYVLGTERHESRRIDNQLRGRSGRQGDPGETRFYLSFEDTLVKRFNFNTAQAIMKRFNLPEDLPIQAGIANKLMANAQSQMEAMNFDTRKDIVKYDKVLSKQREIVYGEREKILSRNNTLNELKKMAHEALKEEVEFAFQPNNTYENISLSDMVENASQMLNTKIDEEDIENLITGKDKIDVIIVSEKMAEIANERFDSKIQEIAEVNKLNLLTENAAEDVAKKVILSTLDKHWRWHLDEMESLKNGINLRSFAQKNPISEYEAEGYELFNTMLLNVKRESVELFFSVQ